jgi:hypothetical protein
MDEEARVRAESNFQKKTESKDRGWEGSGGIRSPAKSGRWKYREVACRSARAWGSEDADPRQEKEVCARILVRREFQTEDLTHIIADYHFAMRDARVVARPIAELMGYVNGLFLGSLKVSKLFALVVSKQRVSKK